jgi:hypothetical protein
MKRVNTFLDRDGNQVSVLRRFTSSFTQLSPIVGLTSMFWLIYRTGTKPSRLQYPCQRVAAANVMIFLGPATLGIAYKVIHMRQKIFSRVFFRDAAVGLLICAAVMTIYTGLQANSSRNRLESHSPHDDHHEPVGIKAGIIGASGIPIFLTSPSAMALPDPNRVVSVHSDAASAWTGGSGFYWQYVNQTIVTEMVDLGVKQLTGEGDRASAWSALIDYQSGETVAIKINLNNCHSCGGGSDDDLDPIPETLNAIILGLKSIGVPEENIWITDPSRVIPARIRDNIPYNVSYFVGPSKSTCNDPNTFKTSYVTAEANTVSCNTNEKIRPPKVLVDADHLINLPILKSHGSYVTLALKNHFGSVMLESSDSLSAMHPYFNQSGNSMNCDLENDNILADINNNEHIRDKTRLIIGDGIFANWRLNYGGIEQWKTFNNDDPNILFFSADPVAVSSVMTDYIVKERKEQSGVSNSQAHQQLEAAARLGLGVHEHWNNDTDMSYANIDYIKLELGDPPVVTPQKPMGVKVLRIHQD